VPDATQLLQAFSIGPATARCAAHFG